MGFFGGVSGVKLGGRQQVFGCFRCFVMENRSFFFMFFRAQKKTPNLTLPSGVTSYAHTTSTSGVDIDMPAVRIQLFQARLVGGLEHFLFSHILGIIIPID